MEIARTQSVYKTFNAHRKKSSLIPVPPVSWHEQRTARTRDRGGERGAKHCSSMQQPPDEGKRKSQPKKVVVENHKNKKGWGWGVLGYTGRVQLFSSCLPSQQELSEGREKGRTRRIGRRGEGICGGCCSR